MIKKKSIIYLIFITILNLLLIGGSLYLYFSIQKQREILKQIPQDLILAETEVQNNKALKKQIEETREYWEKFNSIFLDKDEIISFIENLETLGKKIGLSLEFDSVDTNTEKGQKPHFRFHTEGNFDKLFQFLLLIENYPYQIVFQELRFTKTTELWRADFDIILTSYLDKKI